MLKYIVALSLFLGTQANADTALATVKLFLPTVVTTMVLSPSDEEEKPVTVIASGLGDTCVDALNNAKQVAIEKVNGTWVSGHRYVKKDKYEEEISEYHGGVIKSYKVLKNQCTHVIIEALVVPRTFEVSTSTHYVPEDMVTHLEGKRSDLFERKQAIRQMDNKSRALDFKVTEIKYEPAGEDETLVIIYGNMTINKNWYEDYKSLTKRAGQFDLPTFYGKLYAEVEGMGLAQTKFFPITLNYVEIRDIWKLDTFRGSPNGIEIFPDFEDRLRLTFKIANSDIKHIDSYRIKFR